VSETSHRAGPRASSRLLDALSVSVSLVFGVWFQGSMAHVDVGAGMSVCLCVYVRIARAEWISNHTLRITPFESHTSEQHTLTHIESHSQNSPKSHTLTRLCVCVYMYESHGRNGFRITHFKSHHLNHTLGNNTR